VPSDFRALATGWSVVSDIIDLDLAGPQRRTAKAEYMNPQLSHEAPPGALVV
jgi:hypothetical protein